MESVCGIDAMEAMDYIGSKNLHHHLIIDCRSFLSFNIGRVIDSINVHCPPILKRRSGGFIPLENIVPCKNKRSQIVAGIITDILMYDDSTEDLSLMSKDSNLLPVIKSLLQQCTNITIRYIIGGFEAVRQQFPAAVCESKRSGTQSATTRERTCSKSMHIGSSSNNNNNNNNNNATSTPSFLCNQPAEILPHLYLGDESHSSQQGILDGLGITALVNVSSSCHNHFEDRYQYMNIHIDDSMNADLLSWFHAVNKFIDEVAANNGKVLVHCLAGISRSATVCIAYIMQKYQMTLEKAFDLILAKRPIIDPNLNFIQQLQRFESQCLQKQQCPLVQLPPPKSPSVHTSSVFSFSPVSPFPVPTSTSLHFLSRTAAVPYQAQTHRSKSEIVISSPSVSETQELSPSSLSQTAASPNPMRATPSRPKSLPILQLNASFHQPCHPCSRSPSSLTLPGDIEQLRYSSSYNGHNRSRSPMFEFTHHPEDEVAVAVPMTQDVTFDICPRVSSARSPLASPHHPPHPHHLSTALTTSSNDGRSLSPYLSMGEAIASFPSPRTPHAKSPSSLSPVPSFG